MQPHADRQPVALATWRRAVLSWLVAVIGFAVATACAELPPDATREPVIYDRDDRVDVYAERDEQLRDLARNSVVALVPLQGMSMRRDGDYDMTSPTLIDVEVCALNHPCLSICPDEPFVEQPSLAPCSGVLVDDDLVLSAAHCFRQLPCEDYAFVFDYFYEDVGTLASVSAEDVYRCDRIVTQRYEPEGDGSDFALVKLSRKAGSPRRAVDLRTGPLRGGDLVSTIGFPFGLPAKIDRGGTVKDALKSAQKYFTVTTDTAAGSSGAPIFDDEGRLAGHLVRGGQDLQLLVQNGAACFGSVHVVEEAATFYEQAMYTGAWRTTWCNSSDLDSPLCTIAPLASSTERGCALSPAEVSGPRTCVAALAVILALLTRRTRRPLKALALIGCSLGCASSRASLADLPPAPAASPPATYAYPHETTTRLFEALRRRDFLAAWMLFEDELRARVPHQTLDSVWTTQSRPLGALSHWTVVKRELLEGAEVCVLVLEFERGRLQALVTIASNNQRIVGFFFKPLPAPATRASYVDPESFYEEKVMFGSLHGTLTIPNSRGQSPGAVLIHGSGPSDRDSTIGANRPFKDIAEGLSSRGVAVLRYDKRTLRRGQSTGGVSLDQEVEDAISSVSVLRQRHEVDPQRIFVVGHSLGALLAPEIALRAAPVAGAVLLAPPGRAPWDLLLAQMSYLGSSKTEVAEVEQAAALIRAGKPSGVELLGAPLSYWQAWAARDGVESAKALHKPLLILRGERDYQVTAEDLSIWRVGLDGVADVDWLTLPKLNHLFIAGHGRASPAEYEVPGHVERLVIEALARFMVRSEQD